MNSATLTIIVLFLFFFFHRSSACDRPRTYDRYYQKTPLNYHKSFSSADALHHAANKYRNNSGNVINGNNSTSMAALDSAISLCSSEEDSALLMQRQQQQQEGGEEVGPGGGQEGGAFEVVESTMGPSQRKVKKTKKKRELTYSRTITERDVKHLERHLR